MSSTELSETDMVITARLWGRYFRQNMILPVTQKITIFLVSPLKFLLCTYVCIIPERAYKLCKNS